MASPSFKILNAEPDQYSQEAVQILETLGTVDLKPLTRTGLLECIDEYDVLIVRLGFQIDEQVFNKAKRLKAIVSATTGVDHIDLDAAQKHQITVLCLRGEYEFLRSIPATAELTWGLLLSLLRNIPQAYHSVLQGEWDREKFRGFDLFGKKLGILGLGRIGEKVAQYGMVFGMRVAAYDIDPSKQMAGVQNMASINALFSWADIISIHVPLNESTENLVGQKELTLMDGGFLINTSRGAIVDENELINALKEGSLAGAAVDVINYERQLSEEFSPIIDFAKKHSNLIITPHIGGASFDSMAATEIFMAQKTKSFLEKIKS